MKIKKFRENQELISLANAFSGGVFLSLAFGHMIPHSLEGFESAGYAHNVPFFVVLTGYLMIFFIEKIVEKVLRNFPMKYDMVVTTILEFKHVTTLKQTL